MVLIKCQIFFVVLSYLWTFTTGDAGVSCVFKENCILPCSFTTGDDVVIHWIQSTTGDPTVHSYYHNQDQFSHQDQRFKSRTSLFKDQISRGNASLLLTNLQVQDEATYKCYTSTKNSNKESLVSLKVNAPVSEVDIHQVINSITCSSEGIYPEPELTWSTNPPSKRNFNTTTRVQQNEQQLYNISSSLIISDPRTDAVYSCTISTRRNMRRATLFKPTSINVNNTEPTTILCADSTTPPKSIIWRFNHSQIIVKHTGPNNYIVSEKWKPYVKDVSDTGNLTLQDLSLDQKGMYTCELSDTEETHVTNTFLELREGTNKSVIIGVVTILISGVVLALALVLAWWIYKKIIKTGEGKDETADESSENMQQLNPKTEDK